MNDAYNSRQIDLIFKQILLAANPQLSTLSVKNYLSDLRHFIGWHINSVTNEQTISTFQADNDGIVSLFNSEKLSSYESDMRSNLTNESTLKRRMNSLKLVQRYLIDEGIIDAQAYTSSAAAAVFSIKSNADDKPVHQNSLNVSFNPLTPIPHSNPAL